MISGQPTTRRFAFPSDSPSEEGSPGEVRSRCPSAASLATGPAGLPQRGVSAGFRTANCLAVRRANGRDSGEPAARRAGAAGSASLPTFLRDQESRSPAGASPGKPHVTRNRKVGAGATAPNVSPVSIPPASLASRFSHLESSSRRARRNGSGRL